MAATHTPRLNLNMPNEHDFVNVITDINENMQSIDNAFGMIGSQYDPTATYLKDDYCVHDAKFYRALQDIDTPEAWDATHWVESNIIDEITGTAHSASTLRDIPIMIATTDWTLTGGKYVAEFDTAYITETSKDFVIFDESYKMFAQADVVADKKTGGGGMVFKTAVQPIGYISGTIYTVDANDGKVPVLLEDTVTPIANGGTGQNTLASAKQAFGITALEEDVTTINGNLTNPPYATIKQDGTDKVFFHRIGSLVVCNINGFVLSNYQNDNFIPEGFRPAEGNAFTGLLYNSNNDNYLATCNVGSNGRMYARRKNAVNTRDTDVANYQLFVTAIWMIV